MIPHPRPPYQPKTNKGAIAAKFLKKRMLTIKDPRRKDVVIAERKAAEEKAKKQVSHVDQVSSSLFFKYNTALGPPYHVLIDTNFINFAIRNKMEIVQGMMDSLYAKCIPCVTDCVIAELEKLGPMFRLALLVARDPRFERLPCTHAGTYADDCLVRRVTQQKCYIVATCDRELKSRIRKIPGVPIMYIARHRFTIERMPEAYGDPKG
ncbi:rRNA-processing protein fcf1 [Tieghemiomyces parasiticus]|uniref:rRNA-processing protein fcf1 n=1 Tax=Tieghemiomyces parasiticus TaxID=78921 RepID=A0A9W7ZKI4_9FUNG|nr:rRNA-processing protein fcf1 [Tieghemiomyces parasiticus]